MQISPTPLDRLRGQFSNLQLTAGELAASLHAPFEAGPVDQIEANRLARVLMDVENTLLDADAAQMAGRELADDATIGAAVQQARTGIAHLVDASYDASLYLRDAAYTGTIDAGLDAGPVTELRATAHHLGEIATRLLTTIAAND